MDRKILIREVNCKTAINRTGIPGYDYCLNPYTGCAHSCLYCYADFTRRFTNHREPWGEFVDVKVNFPEALRRQLGGRKPPSGTAILGTVTDSYQPLEGKFRITRASLEVLKDYPDLSLNVLTKSDLITRDIELLTGLKNCSVGFTITTLNDAAARVLEPGAAAPSARLKAAKTLKEAGIDVWVFIAPLLPGIGDSVYALSRLLKGIKRAGIEEVMIDPLNPYPTAVSRMLKAYRACFPDALKQLEWYLSDRGGYLKHLSGILNQCFEEYGFDPPRTV